MAARSIASLSLSFGLVSIPVRLYSATEASKTVSFNLLAPDGSRLEQQYVSKATGQRVERTQMQKGYEFEKDRFVVFTKDELKGSRPLIPLCVLCVAFIPVGYRAHWYASLTGWIITADTSEPIEERSYQGISE